MGMQIEADGWEAESPHANDIAAHASRRSIALREDSPASDALSQTLYKDYRRYRAAGARNAFSVIALTQGFWASTIFRISHWALEHCRVPGLRLIVKAICLAFQKIIEILTGICIPATCNIGRGLYIGHFGGIFIDSDSRLGENCNIAQGVTIGKGGRGELQGVPLLGDHVHIGANAVVLGKITIGNDAAIGPGAVVMSDVPPCGVAMGNPARVVGLTGSFDFVNYDGMENDPARKPDLQPAEERRPAPVAGSLGQGQPQPSKDAQSDHEPPAPQKSAKPSPSSGEEGQEAVTFTSPQFM
jgi:serine O-acetyltransferase